MDIIFGLKNLSMDLVVNEILSFIDKNPEEINLNLDQAIVSFTFDDVPKSAFENALPLLEKRGFKGTWYVCGGYLGEMFDGKLNLSEDDVYKLVELDHEIGCHTYGHLSLWKTKEQDLIKDLDKNKEVLEHITGAGKIISFAYPYGRVGYRIKDVIKDSYSIARGTKGIANIGRTDLYELSAVSLCNEYLSINRIRGYLEDTIEKKGWIIFYTHEVETNYGKYGCSPEYYQRLLDLVEDYKMKTMSVKDVYSMILNREDV